MAGHSKWKNIMHKKAKTDAQRANVFTKISKEIAIAVREGGPEPSSNSRLRDLIQKAKSNNVPNDNIERVIKKAAGGEGEQYEYITYEGYGPGGVAVIVETTTDNRNRTAADIRHYFSKFGGNMGATGCVSFMFSEMGIIVINGEYVDEEKLMEDAIECGADDCNAEEDFFEIKVAPPELAAVRDALSALKYDIVSAEVEKIPSLYVKLESDEHIVKMQKLLDALEDNDDVQSVWHNWDYYNA